MSAESSYILVINGVALRERIMPLDQAQQWASKITGDVTVAQQDDANTIALAELWEKLGWRFGPTPEDVAVKLAQLHSAYTPLGYSPLQEHRLLQALRQDMQAALPQQQQPAEVEEVAVY